MNRTSDLSKEKESQFYKWELCMELKHLIIAKHFMSKLPCEDRGLLCRSCPTTVDQQQGIEAKQFSLIRLCHK